MRTVVHGHILTIKSTEWTYLNFLTVKPLVSRNLDSSRVNSESCTENVIYKFLPILAVKKTEVTSVTLLGIEKVTQLFVFW